MARGPTSARSTRDVVVAVAERRSRHARARRRRRQIALWLVVAVLVGVGSFGAGLLAAPIDYNFQPISPKSVLLLDNSGRFFATIRSPQDQEPVFSRQIPVVLKNAVVAAEDERFFEHAGVDPLAILRALWRDATGAHLQGGSTITQQYVKNVYTGSERTALRKLREASLAIRLEQHLTKDQILTRYLNTLYLGNGTAGVQAASKYYFGVPVWDLDLDPRTQQRSASLALARASMLAGFIPAPSLWNPVANANLARERQLHVLNLMDKDRLVTPQQASAAYETKLQIVARSAPLAATIAPEFRDYVSQQLTGTLALPDTELFDSGQVRVRTTLDLNLQEAAVNALHSVLPKASDPEAAVVAVDPRNGDIRALTTKEDGGYKAGGFDLATNASRSTGSTIKPFTLAVALMHGHTLDEPHSAPQCVTVPYHVCNAESGSSYQTLRTALINSINTVYGPLAVDLGLQRVVGLMRDAGVDVAPLQRDSHHKPFPAQALGVQVSPLSEAVGYSTLVDHGVHHSPRTVLRVTSKLDGDLFHAPTTVPGNRVMPKSVADQVTEVMQGVVDEGTGVAARQDFPVYGKTGTTDDFTNAWFTGCTRTLCIAVWMGYDKQFLNHGRTPHSMMNVESQPGGVFGGTLPADIFAKTWGNYRTLQQPGGKLSSTPSPPPTFSSVPSHSASASPNPSRSSSRSPKPTPKSTPSSPPPQSPTPSQSPPVTLPPTPGPNPSANNGRR